MTRAILLFLAILVPLRGDETIRQTTVGRLMLKVPADQAPIHDVRLSTGTATPAPWESDPALRERCLDIIFPVRWWDWSEISVSFTPVADGKVDLILLGPWELDSSGKTVRKEVLWDQLTADGTSIANGDFESQSDGKPDNWTPLYQKYVLPDAWPIKDSEPLAGKCLAASSQNNPLSQTLDLKAGVPVTLHLHAKAATIPGFISPKRLRNNTPAHKAAASIKRGVNIGNCWEAPQPYSWGVRFTTEDIDRIAAEGFDHIRVPVAWHFHLKPKGDGYEIDPSLLTGLEPVLKRALEKHLHVLLDWHHFDDLTSSPEANRKRFVSSWEAIARHFKSWPPALFLELLNEPHPPLTTEIANSIYADAIAAIHKIDHTRILVVSPGNWGDPKELENLRLPDNDDRIVVTVHCYEPFYFTHQGASWVNLEGLKGIEYPGPPATPLALPEKFKDNAAVRDFIQDYNTLPAGKNPCSANRAKDLLEIARRWSLHFGRPVHLGEFGSVNMGNPESRQRYSRDIRTLAESRNIPWTLWEWKAGFGYWDSSKNAPLLRKGLFE